MSAVVLPPMGANPAPMLAPLIPDSPFAAGVVLPFSAAPGH
jgi:hypothetical protein